MKKCINCKKIIAKRAKRCHSCENKRRHKLYLFGKMNLKHGRYTKRYFCVDCEKELSNRAGGGGAIRCLSCSTKKRYKNPKNNPAYKDGRTLIWNRIRKQCFEKDNYSCQLCNKKKINNYLNCHHIINRHICLDKFDLNNLITLCRNCHNFITSIEKTNLYDYYKEKFLQQRRSKDD